MVYLIAFSGFLFGFLFGQGLLSRILRDKSRQDILDLMKDPASRLKYGLINWGMAFLWMIVFGEIYRIYWL